MRVAAWRLLGCAAMPNRDEGWISMRWKGMRAALPIAAGVLALAGAPGAAAQEFHENVRHPCQDYWMVTRAEILSCLRADYAAADAELNRVYQEKMGSLDEAGRASLRESQRAWLERYDAVLTSYYARPWSNHSIVKVLPSQIRAVRDRTAWLRRR
jgi:uncharacterized protein YecT (DUF1311 family)